MRMREDDRVQRRRIELKGKVIPRDEFRVTLNKTTIDKNTLRIVLHEKARTGYGLSSAEKLDAEHADQLRKRNACHSNIRPTLA